MIRALDKWLLPHLRQRLAPPPPVDGTLHILLCICDHFEPDHDATPDQAQQRIRHWLDAYPRLFDAFRDADDRPPRHTFFFPTEQYNPSYLDQLATLRDANYAEVELHLHHDNDTGERLHRKLEEGKAHLDRHGLLSRDRSGRLRYAFVHGDWALANSHPGGRFCGVRNELAVLLDTGCYADFTMPSAPSPTQARTINAIYYAAPSDRPRAHDFGAPATVGITDRDGLLLIQGPLALNWRRRKWGLIPRIENAEISGANPPTPDRMALWNAQAIHVRGRPQWRVIKLHTHGALPANTRTLLDQPMVRFHQHLRQHWNDGRRYRLHYVTARELANIVHAAEADLPGSPDDHRDFRYHHSA